MDDLISRQAAIDAVKMGALSAATIYGRTDEGSTALYETVRAIKALPFAQPEIVRCKDCEFWREHKYAKGTKRYIPFCGLNAIYTKSDDFCSRAERRTDEQT